MKTRRRTATAIAITGVLMLGIIGGAACALWPTGSNATRPVGHLAPGQNPSPATTSLPGPSNPGTAAGPRPSAISQLPAQLPASAKSLRVPILMYHYVDATPPPAGRYADGLTVRTPEFQAQMNYLAAHGYHPVTLEQIYAAMAGQEPLPVKPVAITFDDGGLDNFTVAFPILRANGFVASFFVITGAVGRSGRMTWDQLRAMHSEGMAIESHTVHHPNLRTLKAAGLAQEVTQSRTTLMDQIGESPVVLAYPSGAYNQIVIAATRAAGYLAAVTTHPGKTLDSSHTYEWPRVRVSPGQSLASFAKNLE